MDKTAKVVLKYISDKGTDYFGAFVDERLQAMASDIGISKIELRAALLYLKDNNYIEFFKAYGGKEDNAFRLTHEGIHYKEIKRLKSCERWKERFWGFTVGVLVTLVSQFILECLK